MGDGVAGGDGKVFFDPGMERGHIAHFGFIIQNHIGTLLGQFLIILDEPRVAVGTGDDGRLTDGQGTARHHKAKAVLLANSLQHLLARKGFQRFVQGHLHIGGFFVRPGPCGGACGDLLQVGCCHIGRLPTRYQNAPEPAHQQKYQQRRQHTLALGQFSLLRLHLPACQHGKAAAERGPGQIHKGSRKAQQRRAQNECIRRHARQKAQPEQRLPRRAAPLAERPGRRQHQRRHKVALIGAGVRHSAHHAEQSRQNGPKVQGKADPIPFLAGFGPPQQTEHHAGGQRLCQEFGGVQCLACQQGQPLACGKIILRVVQDQADALQKRGKPHAGQHIRQKRCRAGHTAQHKQHRAAGDLTDRRLLAAAAQQHHADKNHRRRQCALRERQKAEAGAHRPQHYQPWAAETMGIIMVKAQKCRHGEVELLADIIRPQEPLGGVDKQHHRAQQRPMAANGLLEIAVKYRAHGRFADQHHSAHKQQRPGGCACNGGIQSQHQRCQ